VADVHNEASKSEAGKFCKKCFNNKIGYSL
jgi:hypothetical protein